MPAVGRRACVQTPPHTHTHGNAALQVPLNEYEFPTHKVANVQAQLERLVEKNYYLHQSARDAYRGYLLAYNSHALKEIFNVHRLDLAVSGRRTWGPPRPLGLPTLAAPHRCR